MPYSINLYSQEKHRQPAHVCLETTHFHKIWKGTLQYRLNHSVYNNAPIKIVSTWTCLGKLWLTVISEPTHIRGTGTNFCTALDEHTHCLVEQVLLQNTAGFENFVRIQMLPPCRRLLPRVCTGIQRPLLEHYSSTISHLELH